MRSDRRIQLRLAAFSLLEMVIATAMALMVMLVAYGAFAVAASTVTEIGRQGRQNDMLRRAFAEALETVDFWDDVDRPESLANGSGRRLFNPADALAPAIQGSAGNVEAALGLPFQAQDSLLGGGTVAAYHWDGSYGVPAVQRLRGATVIRPDAHASLEPLRDPDPQRGLLNPLRVQELDADRGRDDLPYQACDPRRWWRGNFQQWGAGAGRPWGRYESMANFRKGFALDGVEWDPVPPAMPDAATGLPRPAVPTMTWLPTQIAMHYDLLGVFGSYQCMPINTIWQAPRDDGLDPRWTRMNIGANNYQWGKIAGSTYGFSYDSTVPFLSRSWYTGGWVVGYESQWYLGIWANDPLSGVNLGTYHAAIRQKGAPITAHGYASTFPIQNLATVVSPLAISVGDGYPDTQYGIFRAFIDGHAITNVRLRWTDTKDQQIFELTFGSFGTTLPGARRQRHPDGGWSAFVAADLAAFAAAEGLSGGQRAALEERQRHLDSLP